MERTKPVQVEVERVKIRRGAVLKTLRLTCECGVSLTYCADEETLRRERTWQCYRCSRKYALNDCVRQGGDHVDAV